MNNIFIRAVRKLTQSSFSNSNRLKSTFKAAVIKEIGKPLEIEERESEQLEGNQVRVQVDYCSVNKVDVFKFQHGHGDLPFVPGYELSGDVIEIGNEVPQGQVLVGDRVVGLSLEKFGGIAEQCVLDVDDVWRLPSEVNKKEGAVIAYGHSTALYAFSKIAPLKENDRIMISAGSAGLGLAAVDVAANVYKAKIIGLVDTEERGELVRQKGAFETLNFSDRLTSRCLRLTDNKGVHVVYDAVGGSMMDTIGSCVSVGGKVLYAAPYFYKTIPAPRPHSFATILSLKQLRRQNLHLYKTVVADTLELAHQGIIGAHVSASYSLKDINEAIKFIEDRKCTGKVLIHLEES